MLNKPEEILIVDDLKSNQLLLKDLLEDEYQDIKCVNSGSECLNYLDNFKPKLILLDIVMPIMDGLEVCKKIKNNPHTQDIPVIFVTAEKSDDKRLSAYSAGGEEFISKPFNDNDLKEKIRNVLFKTLKTKKIDRISEITKKINMELEVNSSIFQQINLFLIKIEQCHKSEQIAEEILRTCTKMGLNSCVQIKGIDSLIYAGDNLNKKSIELEMLKIAANKGDFYGDQKKLFINTSHISILIQNMPSNQPHLDRLKHMLSTMTHFANDFVQLIYYKEKIDQIFNFELENDSNDHSVALAAPAQELNTLDTNSLLNIYNELYVGLLSLELNHEQEEHIHSLFSLGSSKLNKLVQNKGTKLYNFSKMIDDIKKLK